MTACTGHECAVRTSLDNGLEVLEAVRADAYFRELPIFCVLTSSSDPRDFEKAKRLGVSGYCTKASSMDEYVAFFDSLV